RDFGDKQEAEEKRQPLDRLFAAQLERVVVEAIDRHADQVEHRQHDDADQDRVKAVPAVEDIGRVGTEQDKRRLGNIGDVEHAEGNLDADRHRGVKAAEQDPGDDRIDEKIE